MLLVVTPGGLVGDIESDCECGCWESSPGVIAEKMKAARNQLAHSKEELECWRNRKYDVV